MIAEITTICLSVGVFQEKKGFKPAKHTHTINLIHRVDIFEKNNCKEVVY